MVDTALVAVIATVVVAFAGYLITYFNNLNLSQRAERLDRVNRQLSELYGPMFSIVKSSNRTYDAFNEDRIKKGFKRVCDEKRIYDEKRDKKNMEKWILWVNTVFMPNNDMLYDIIINKADLLIEEEMPKVLLDFCAHVATYRPVVEKWKKQDYSESTSLLDYPREELEDYATKSYLKLKKEQAELLGSKKSK